MTIVPQPGIWWVPQSWKHKVFLGEQVDSLLTKLLTPNVYFFLFWHQIHDVFSNTTSPVLWHQLGVLQLNSILSLTTQTLQVNASVPQDCPHLKCQPQWATQVFHISAWFNTNLGYFQFSLRFDNFLEQLTEIRKTLCLCLLIYCLKDTTCLKNTTQK